jgi:hypothetical protein
MSLTVSLLIIGIVLTIGALGLIIKLLNDHYWDCTLSSGQWVQLVSYGAIAHAGLTFATYSIFGVGWRSASSAIAMATTNLGIVIALIAALMLVFRIDSPEYEVVTVKEYLPTAEAMLIGILLALLPII